MTFIRTCYNCQENFLEKWNISFAAALKFSTFSVTSLFAIRYEEDGSGAFFTTKARRTTKSEHKLTIFFIFASLSRNQKSDTDSHRLTLFYREGSVGQGLPYEFFAGTGLRFVSLRPRYPSWCVKSASISVNLRFQFRVSSCLFVVSDSGTISLSISHSSANRSNAAIGIMAKPAKS